MYAVGVSGLLCLLMDEMGRFAFWSLYAETGVMRVYNVDGDGHVSSCLGSLSEKIKIIL